MSRKVLLIAVSAVLAALPLSFGAFWINMMITAMIFSLAVFSINFLTGLTGLLSFGQAGFVGIGAYTLGVLAKQGHPPLLAGLYGVLLAMLSGFLLGLPAARLKGHYLAIGTLGFGILIYQLLTNSVEITRGPMGLIGIPTGGIDKQTWYLVMLGVCLIVLAALVYIDRYSSLGVVLKMVRHDEIAAQASGINVFAVKLIAFTVSAGFAGLSGALFAAYVRFLTPDLFNEQESFRYMMMAVVGGIGSPLGGFAASLLLTIDPGRPEGPGRGQLPPARLRNDGALRTLVPACRHRRPHRTAASMSALELFGVSKRFGGLKALSDISLSVSPGEVLGLIGPNGAGKSTLVSCITGVLRIDDGTIRFRKRDIQGLPPHQRARCGIARTFQKVRLADQLTVYENVAAGLASRWFSHANGWPLLFRPLSAASIAAAVNRTLEQVGLVDVAATTVRSLPFGRRHFVEIARAIVSEPSLLLLDEPATGLTERERERLAMLVKDIAAGGCAQISDRARS